MKPERSSWTRPQWQAYIEVLPTFEERKEALQEVPEQWREQVKRHLQTVWAIKKFYSKQGKNNGSNKLG